MGILTITATTDTAVDTVDPMNPTLDNKASCTTKVSKEQSK